MLFPSFPHPRHRAGVRRLGRGAALALSTVVVLGSASPAPAQPSPNDGRVSQEQQAASYRWRELQNQMSAVELTEPEKAIAAYQAFYETSGHLYVEVAVSVTSRIAQVYGRNLKNPAKAVELYAWALEQWGQTPYRERLQREAEQMKALLAKAGTNKAGASPVAPKDGAVKRGVGLVPVVPFQAVGVPPVVGVPSVGEVPSAVKAPAVLNVPSTVGMVFSVGGSKLAVALNEIEAGRLSAEDAWARGELSVAQARALLEQLNPWGKVEGRIGNQTRRALALVVVAHDPELMEKPATLTLAQRLWIGDALGNARDGRCVALLGSVVEEMKRRVPLTIESEIVAAYIASERLAWFYEDSNDLPHAVSCWLTALKTSNGWWGGAYAGARAVTLLMQLGEEKGADQVIAQVESGSFSGFWRSLPMFFQASYYIETSNLKVCIEFCTQKLVASKDPAYRFLVLCARANALEKSQKEHESYLDKKEALALSYQFQVDRRDPFIINQIESLQNSIAQYEAQT